MGGSLSRMLGFSPDYEIPVGFEDQVVLRLDRYFNDGVVDLENYRCTPYIGQITHLTEQVAVIDNSYIFPLTNSNLPDLKIGHVVSCLLYMNERDTMVKKVVMVESGEENIIEEEKEDSNHLPKRASDYEYTIKAEIVEKTLRDVTVKSNDSHFPSITFNMDHIRSEFIPQPGDLIILYCSLVKGSSENSPEIVIEEIQPENTVVESGDVTHWDATHGSINHCYYFSLQCCESGYQPAKGDKVLASLIRSNIESYVWRAIQVIPQNNSVDGRLLKETEKARKELMRNKNGVSIGTVDCFSMKTHEEKLFFIKVANNSSLRRRVKSCINTSNIPVPQIRLVSPSKWPVFIEPHGQETFQFKIFAQYLGRSTEQFVWSFGDFEIGRQFKVNVLDSELPLEHNVSCTKQLRGNRKNVTASQLLERSSGYLLPGRPSFSPASFVPVKLGQFSLPENVLSAALPDDKMNLDDLMIRVSKVLPGLTKDLCPSTYSNRMHALLYLEEVAMLKQIGELEMDASFKKVGECLVLDVPALSPYTTKLVAGDMLNASSKDRSDPCRHEGIIHKVTSTQLWLQFATDFHLSIDESRVYTVSFTTSRASLRRMHQAVSLASKCLGPSWLFPSKIFSRAPQVTVEDELPEEDISSKQDHNQDSGRSKKLLQLLKELPKSSKFETMKHLAEVWEQREHKEAVEKTVEEEQLLYGPDPRMSSAQPTSLQLSIEQKLQAPSTRSSIGFRRGQANRRGRGRTHWNRYGSGYGVRCTLDGESNALIREDQIRTIKWFNSGLNEQQKYAVKNVLAGEARPLPYILFGPPGTGKTVTVVEIILQIYSLIPHSRLLVATPSNSAADLITERILSCVSMKQKDLLRLVGYHYLEQGRISAIVLPFSAVPDVKAINLSGTSGSSCEGVKMCGREDLGHHRITIGTMGCLGLLYNMGFPRGHFTHIIVDEAGQATEPEVLIPMGNVENVFLHKQYGQVVLAGDPLQLGPVVTSRLATLCGLQDSLLTRLLARYPYAKDIASYPSSWGYDPRLVTKLVYNYRSLPKILQLPSILFYDNELISLVCEKTSEEAKILEAIGDKIPCGSNGSAPPFLFHGVRGQNQQEENSHSWSNPQEIAQVVMYLMTLYCQGITADQIGVITPYQLQSNKIRKTLEKMGMESPKVGSVEEFQGQERMVVIVSVVRSSPDEITHDMKAALGFVANSRRLNVALTRARALLIIVGNPHLLSLDTHWRSVLHFCVRTGAYVGCDLPPDSVPVKFIDEINFKTD